MREEESAEWILTTTAAKMLHVSTDHLYSMATRADEWPLVRKRPRSIGTGSSARGTGWLYWRRDIERIAEIRRVTKLRFRQALSVFGAERLGKL